MYDSSIFWNGEQNKYFATPNNKRTIPLIQFSVHGGRDKYFDSKVFDYNSQQVNTAPFADSDELQEIDDLKYNQLESTVQKEISPLSVMEYRNIRKCISQNKTHFNKKNKQIDLLNLN